MPKPEPSIAFEETPALVLLRKSVWDATRSLNGIIVALETLRHVEPVKPDDRILSWHPSEDPTDSQRTRAFAMRSAMVAVVDGVDRYLRVVTRVNGLVDEDLHDYLNGRWIRALDRRPTVFERLRYLSDWVPGAVSENLLLAFDLLATWRNEFVHYERRHPLSRTKKEALKAQATWFTENRGGADIVSTVARYEAAETPTIADLVTLFAAAQRAVSNIDERLLLRTSGTEYAVALMSFLLKEDANPTAMLERVFEHGGTSSSGTIHALFLHWGANHDERRRANAPSLTRRELDALLGLGRNRAKELFLLEWSSERLPSLKR